MEATQTLLGATGPLYKTRTRYVDRQESQMATAVPKKDATMTEITVPKHDFDVLVEIGQLYMDAFGDDDRLSILEALRLSEVRDILTRYE